MTFIVELTPAQEARLREEAARAGLDPAALLRTRAGLEEPETGLGAGEFPHVQEWQQEAERFRHWANSHIQKGPGLSLDDLSRESIYGEHG